MAFQLLASIEDINAFLPDLVEIQDGDDNQLQIDAQRVVKSQLAGVFTPVVLSGWDEPDDTPPIIRSIAGRLIAAKFYAQKLSQESTDIPKYSQGIYNEAIMMLAQIRSGALIVVDDDDNPIPTSGSADLDSGDVYPNNAAPDPVFGMTSEFG